ncbi:MAG: bile acid:sodium symporter [Pseudomonadota bacterium]|nr:bile acid:sodium symporter [Pseudomonadota bacterium]
MVTLSTLTNINTLIIASIIIGILFPKIADFLFPLLYYQTVILFFISLIESKDNAYKKPKKKDTETSIQKTIIISSVKLLILPIIIPYLVYAAIETTEFTPFAIAMGIALKFSTGSTSSMPTIARNLDGNERKADIYTIASNLFCIFTILIVLLVTSHQAIQISKIKAISYFIAQIMIPPIVIASICQHLIPYTIKKYKHYLSPISKVILVSLFIAACKGLDKEISQKPLQSLTIITISACTYVILTILGWHIERSNNKKEKITSCLYLGTPGNIAILFAHTWFPLNTTIIACTVISGTLYPIVTMTCKQLSNIFARTKSNINH